MKGLKLFKTLSYTTILTSVLLFNSCKKDEQRNYSTLVKSAASVQIVGVPSILVVREDTAGVIATISVSLSEPQIVDIHVPISQIAGDAEQDADYELSTNELVFPAYTTGPQTFTVTILDDDIVESDETFKLQVGNDKNTNATITPVTMDVTITNATSLDFDMSFSWSKNYVLHYWDVAGNDTTVNARNAIDLDFYVFDSLGSLGGNDLGIYDAATAFHPEELVLTAPDQEGVYVISVNLWTNVYRLLGYGALSVPQGPFPVTTTFSRKGALEPIELVQDESLAFNTNTEDSENDGASNFQDLFRIEVKPDYFIITKLDGTLFTNGRVKQPFYKYHKHESLPQIFKFKK